MSAHVVTLVNVHFRKIRIYIYLDAITCQLLFGLLAAIILFFYTQSFFLQDCIIVCDIFIVFSELLIKQSDCVNMTP